MSDLVARLRSAAVTFSREDVATRHVVHAAEKFTAAADEIASLRSEVKRLQQEADDNWARGIHTCHQNCTRIECVQRREIERLTKERDQAISEIGPVFSEVERLRIQNSKVIDANDRLLEQRDQIIERCAEACRKMPLTADPDECAFAILALKGEKE